MSLTRDGHDHETKTIILQAARAKMGRGRVLRCGQNTELVAILERRIAERRLDLPLIFHNGESRHVGNFSTSWGRALGRVKVSFAFHDLRRTAVLNMIRAGVPERLAMEISGHRDSSGPRPVPHRQRAKPRRRDGDARRLRGGDVQGKSTSKRKEPATFPSAKSLST